MSKRALLIIFAAAIILTGCANINHKKEEYGTVDIPVEPVVEESLAPITTTNPEAYLTPAPHTDNQSAPPSQSTQPSAPMLANTPRPALNTKEFWEKEEDLYRKYDVTQESVSTYAVVTDVKHNKMQNRYAITIHPVTEEYESFVNTDEETGRSYTDYKLTPKTDSTITLTFLLDPSGAYTYANPYDPAFTSSQAVSVDEFAKIAATKTTFDEPLYFKIQTISGTVYAARMWDMFYAARAYELREAAEAEEKAQNSVGILTPIAQ